MECKIKGCNNKQHIKTGKFCPIHYRVDLMCKRNKRLDKDKIANRLISNLKCDSCNHDMCLIYNEGTPEQRYLVNFVDGYFICRICKKHGKPERELNDNEHVCLDEDCHNNIQHESSFISPDGRHNDKCNACRCRESSKKVWKNEILEFIDNFKEHV